MKTQSLRSGALSGAPFSNSRGSTERAVPKQNLRRSYMSNKMSMGVGLMRTLRFVSGWAITITLAQALFLWLPAQAEAAPRVRQNYKDLTQPQKDAFVNACLALKAIDPGATNDTKLGWDDIVKMHDKLFLDGIHHGPVFLAWHRDLLLRLEDALRATHADNAAVTIPYWDWTQGFPADLTALVGGDGDPSDNYIVKTGPFAHSAGNWNITVDQCCSFGPYGGDGPQLKRGFGLISSAPSLPTGLDVTGVLMVGQESTFDTCKWDPSSIDSFRNRLEGWDDQVTQIPRMHNRVHVWVGGNMLIGGSPNDPLFFMHHANVDRIWCQWQAAHPFALHHLPSGGGTCFEYPLYPPNDPCTPLEYDLACTDMDLDDLFGLPNRRPVDMLNMRALGFEYDDCVGPCQFGDHCVGETCPECLEGVICKCPCEFGTPGDVGDLEGLTFSQVMILDGL